MYDPAGDVFPCIADGDAYRAMIATQGGPDALEQWLALERAMAPLQQGASLFPAAAIRSDLGVVLTAARFGPQLAMTGLLAGTLTAPFARVVDRVVTDPWLRKFLDLECFVLSGMLARDTICAEMAFMFMERNSGRSSIDYPMGGAGSLVNALVRGLKKHGGRLELRAHVDGVLMQGGLPCCKACSHPRCIRRQGSRSGCPRWANNPGPQGRHQQRECVGHPVAAPSRRCPV